MYCIYKAEKLSVYLHFWHTYNLVVSASIGMGFAQNKSCVFEENKVYFYKPTEPTVHQQECVKDKINVSSH